MKIGIISSRAAGANTAAAYLSQQGYVSISIDEQIKNLLREDGIPATDASVKEWKETAHEDPDPGFYYRKIMAFVPEYEENLIIHGIDNLALIDVLKNRFPVKMLAIDAPTEIRYPRAQMTELIQDSTTYDQFREEETANIQNLRTCMAKADYTILNNKTIPDFTRELDAFISKVS